MITTVTNVRALSEVPGAVLPAPVQEAIAAARRVDSLSRPDGYVPGARAVATAIIEGRDPHTDPAVQAAIVSDQIALWSRGAVDIAWQDAAQVAAVHADEIVEAWRPIFDPAAKDLADAVPSIGEHAHDSAEALEVLNRGGDAAAQWVKVKAALRTIDQVMRSWNALAALAGVGSNPSPERQAYVVSDLTTADYARLGKRARGTRAFHTPPRVDPWDIARAGHTLRLATISEHRQSSRRRTEEAREAAEAPPVNPNRNDPSRQEMARLAKERLSPEALKIAEQSRKSRAGRTA